jgi:hypothetical protein
MKRFVDGENRSQSTMFPESLEEYIAEDNPVRVVDVFVDELDLKGLGFESIEPEVTPVLRCVGGHRRNQVQGSERPRPQHCQAQAQSPDAAVG